MDRRTFIGTAAASLALPSLAKAFADYSPGLVSAELKAGKTVFVDFSAHWCTTCARQERIIGELRGSNPAYNDNISFVKVDWDRYGNDTLAQSLNIPRRSTLVVLKGNQELGRIVAGTSRGDIKALMDTALTAATA